MMITRGRLMDTTTAAVVVLVNIFSLVSTQNSAVVGGCSQVADVIFVIDSSNSVRETCALGGGDQPTDNWQLIVNYVSQVVRAMPIDSTASNMMNRSRVGVVTFSTAVNTVLPLGVFVESQSLADNITALPFVGGNTNMTGALRHVRQMFAADDSHLQQSRQQIIVLLTDGINNIDGDPIQESRFIKQSNIQLIVVGVTDYVDVLQLEEIASTPANYNFLYAEDFGHLNFLVSQTLDRLVCSDPPPAQPCRDSVVDIAFLLDSSGSIIDNDPTHANWDLMKNVVATMIEGLRVSKFDTRVALIRFSFVAEVIFTLDQYFTAAEAVKAVRAMDIVGSQTNTSGALAVMREILTPGRNGSRLGVNKVGIVITDGNSDNRELTINNATLAKNDGIQMFSIGVADLIDADELRAIASPPVATHYYNRTSFALVSTVTSQLLWSVCHSACDTPADTGVTMTTGSTQQQPCSNVSFCPSNQVETWVAYPQHLLLGLSYATLSYVSSPEDCKTRCRQDFACRSVEYIAALQHCSVSYYTKDQAPEGSFRQDSEVDYYELNCAPVNTRA